MVVGSGPYHVTGGLVKGIKVNGSYIFGLTGNFYIRSNLVRPSLRRSPKSEVHFRSPYRDRMVYEQLGRGSSKRLKERMTRGAE